MTNEHSGTDRTNHRWHLGLAQVRMTISETVIVGLAIVAGTVAAALNHLTPELSGLLGVAIGYGGKGAVTTAGSKAAAWKGTPE